MFKNIYTIHHCVICKWACFNLTEFTYCTVLFMTVCAYLGYVHNVSQWPQANTILGRGAHLKNTATSKTSPFQVPVGPGYTMINPRKQYDSILRTFNGLLCFNCLLRTTGFFKYLDTKIIPFQKLYRGAMSKYIFLYLALRPDCYRHPALPNQ